MSLNNQYTKFVAIGDAAYTILQGDDVITFTIATGRTATLPTAGSCSPMTTQNVKLIISSASSVGNVTIAAPSGNTLVGVGFVEPGQVVRVTSSGSSVWTAFGGGGQAGTSGYSGPSGFSGFSGPSGYSGFSGFSGYSGFSGFSGYSGFSGFSGYSGFSGFSGASGYSGFSGPSGYSGYSGVSGYSGFSGFSGPIGGSTGGTDNAALRADGTGGATLQNSNLTIPDDAAATEVGYLNIPQNSQSTAYTTVIADRQKHIFHPAADTTARIWTIDSNANVPYAIGTALTFINDQNTVTIAITSDTLVWAEDGSTGSRTLAENGMATAIKVTSTRWIISGVGLS